MAKTTVEYIAEEYDISTYKLMIYIMNCLKNINL